MKWHTIMERLSRKMVNLFDIVIRIRKSLLRNLFLLLRRDDIMSTAACTRCGSLIHSRVPIDASWNHDSDEKEIEKLHHVICVGCSFEWVE